MRPNPALERTRQERPSLGKSRLPGRSFRARAVGVGLALEPRGDCQRLQTSLWCGPRGFW